MTEITTLEAKYVLEQKLDSLLRAAFGSNFRVKVNTERLSVRMAVVDLLTSLTEGGRQHGNYRPKEVDTGALTGGGCVHGPATHSSTMKRG